MLAKLVMPKGGLRRAVPALACMGLLACGGDDGGGAASDGGASSGSGTRVVDTTSSQWDALCRRFRDTADYSVLAECVASSTTTECQTCLDGFQAPDDTPCADRIGELGSYPASCDWTVEELDACFDERERRLDTWSCETLDPDALGDENNCLYQFRQVCVPESI